MDFLANQEASRRTLESLLGQRRELLGLPPLVPSATPISVTHLALASIPTAPVQPAVLASKIPAPTAPVEIRRESASPKPSSAQTSTASTSSAVAAAVLAVVSEKTGYPTEMLTLEMGLDSDLGIDSIKRVEIMAALRAPDGCPWDREQTLASLRPFVLEETYEVLEAIDRHDHDALKEELGDFVFEAVFLAELEARAGRFTMADALEG